MTGPVHTKKPQQSLSPPAGDIPASSSPLERIPPQDMEAEQSVLGGMMLSKDSIAEVIESLKGHDFYRPAHETIFQAILGLYAKDEPADPITVTAELTRRGELSRVGGPGYVHGLVQTVPTAANAVYYAEIVHERAVLRRLLEAGTRITQMACAGDGDVDDIVNSAQSEVYAVTEKRSREDYRAVGALLEGALNEIEVNGSRGGQLVGLSTGYSDFDHVTQGLHPGQFLLVAGRPAMGKSCIALDWCRNVSIKYGLASVYFSLEMGRNELVMRMLAAEARVALHHLRSGSLTDEDWMRLSQRMPKIAEAPLYIDDSPNLTMMEIRAKCRKLKQQHDLKLVVIDYLQLMQLGSSRRPETRQQEVSEMSRNLKLLAKELELPIVALSQLNRGPEQRQDRRPMPSDLRESGSLEQDCDLAAMVYREDQYEKESPSAGEGELIIAKHRNGPTTTIKLAFQGHYSRFVDMADT